MKIVTWNINSLNARKDLAARFLDEVQPDVIGLQELKLETDKVPRDLFTSRGYEVAAFGQKSWNGVLIAARSPISDVVSGLSPADEGEARLIAATVAGVRVVNVYCPQGQSVESDRFPFKLGFFDGLCDFIARTHEPEQPLVLMGDLNIAPTADDIWDPAAFANTPSYHPLEHQRWRRLIDWGLVDVVQPRIAPQTYSFWDYRGGDFRFNHGMRIDHVLATRPVADRVVQAEILRDWRKKKDGMTPSDHAPVAVTLRGQEP